MCILYNFKYALVEVYKCRSTCLYILNSYVEHNFFNWWKAALDKGIFCKLVFFLLLGQLLFAVSLFIFLTFSVPPIVWFFFFFFLSLNMHLQGQETTLICTLEVSGSQRFKFSMSNRNSGLRLLYYALYLLTRSKK